MDLIKQVCTKEQSIKLKSLGIKQAGIFVWVDKKEEPQLVNIYNFDFYDLDPRSALSAFTATELGKMLGYRTSCHPKENEAQFRAALLIEDLEKGHTKKWHVDNRLLEGDVS